MPAQCGLDSWWPCHKSWAAWLLALLLSGCQTNVSKKTSNDDQELAHVLASYSLPKFTGKSKYSKRWELTYTQLQTVLAVARLCGFEEVEEVRTVRWGGIRVESKPVIQGRLVTSKKVLICYVPWRNGRQPGMGPEIKRVFDFWADASEVETHVEATFHIRGEYFRATLGNDVSITKADDILKAFSEGKIQWNNHKFPNNWLAEGVTLYKPTFIGFDADKNRYLVRYDLVKDLSIFAIIEFEYMNNTIMVHQSKIDHYD